jgi:poly(3-hydroxybutyrate) depolymerase
MDAHYYLETIRVVFQDFSLVSGTWDVRSPEGKIERVRPGDIKTTALMSVEGELDDISGIGQTKAVHDICTGVPERMQKHFEASGAGHYGIFSGRRWRELVYPQVKAFIQSYQPAPGKPLEKAAVAKVATPKAVVAKVAAVKAVPAKKSAPAKAAAAPVVTEVVSVAPVAAAPVATVAPMPAIEAAPVVKATVSTVVEPKAPAKTVVKTAVAAKKVAKPVVVAAKSATKAVAKKTPATKK